MGCSQSNINENNELENKFDVVIIKRNKKDILKLKKKNKKVYNY